jgi:exopolysaccharide production protein ExoZ
MKIHFLQALRALAAWLVVLDHTLLAISGNAPESAITHLGWTLGDAGVYMFFVISGFIMVVISWKEFARPKAEMIFFRRRFTRIAPLYWIATMGALLFHLVSRSHTSDFHVSELIRSLLFIPGTDKTGRIVPILQQGWTLSYEMMFYTLFGFALALERRVAIVALVCALVALVLLKPFMPAGLPTALASPIVLWFVLGIAAGCIWCSLQLAEPQWLARSAGTLEIFGDASYSTYLAHGIVLTLLSRLWVHAFGAPSYGIVPVGLVLATLVGWLAHIAVEKPVLRVMPRVWTLLDERAASGGALLRRQGKRLLQRT